ncbi:urease accessory protein UreF [Rhodococcus spelaei]|uniref:Urease accessory protein UreF n=1 Tax=Rhodococcus spelaei TaxID=2546320 RepID=A0A541B915_9NOCA|nr:urease accessory protein UreF [Rhodococcus spelaei]TQF68797.1 urease accessory protein UreF [Rhodococcus spelaei]
MRPSLDTTDVDITRAARIAQFADSMFPTGSFSFSNGLESAVSEGVVTDAATLREFVLTAGRQAATCDGVALLTAHRSATAGDFVGVLAADHAVFSRKLNEEARTMSTRMGKKLAELGVRLGGGVVLGKWLTAIVAADTPGTYPVGVGIAFADMNSPEQDAFVAHQYGVAMTILGAALRTLRVDHVDTQQILYEVNGNTAGLYAEIAERTLDDMSTFAPMADILAAVHVRSHVRMFMN